MSAHDELVALLEGASHALRSYQYGNSTTDLAENMANKIDPLLSRLKSGELVVVPGKVLSSLDATALGGLCCMRHDGTREFLKDIRKELAMLAASGDKK